MPTEPDTVADTVIYSNKDIHASKNVSVNLLNDARLDLWGNVYYNGVLLGSGGGAGLSGATNAETIAGTVTNKAVTPANLKYERPYFDIRTYGAVGDGTADDTAAIQAAINAAGNGSRCTGGLSSSGTSFD